VPRVWTFLLAFPASFGFMMVVSTTAAAKGLQLYPKAHLPLELVAKGLEKSSKLPRELLQRRTQTTTMLTTRLQSLIGLHVADVLLSDKYEDRPLSPPSNSTVGMPSVEELSDQSSSNPAAAQMTSVAHLSNVQPTDWAFQALQALAERYGCADGYPDGTYRGERAITRYEFAAGLNACLTHINKLIATATVDKFSQSDLVTVQRLQKEFVSEMTTLHGRIDALEATTTKLEANQFSTTTKLRASALLAAVSILTGQNARGQTIATQPTFAERVQLNFLTSFTGRDLLRTRIRARSTVSLSGTATGTPDGDLRFTGATFSTGAGNNLTLDTLAYIFPIGKNTLVYLDGNSGEIDDTVGTLNPFVDGDGNFGALSNFATRNSIYYLVNGSGLGIRQNLGDRLVLGLGYLATTGNNPSPGRGLFNGPYGGIAQLVVKPSKQFNIAFTYVNAYNSDLTAGSVRANLRSSLLSNSNLLFTAVGGGPGGPNPGNAVGSAPSGNAALPGGLNSLKGESLPIISNSYAIEATWRLAPKFLINGWVGYTATRTLSTLGGAINRGDLSILDYAIIFAFPDLGKQGSLGGFVFGMEPRVVGVSHSLKSQVGTDPNNSFHIEGFYQYQISDNVAITPGVIWITNPNFNARNADLVIGVVRTRFTF